LAQIRQHEIKEEDTFPYSNYVLYKIDIITNIKEWYIYRRYSKFEELHSKLIGRIKLLPDFPEKKFFNLSTQIINARKKQLEYYLNFLFNNVDLYYFSEILEFIEFEEDLLMLLEKKRSVTETPNNVFLNTKSFIGKTPSRNLNNLLPKSKSQEHFKEQNYYHVLVDYKLSEKNTKGANMIVIEEFLKNLENILENKSAIIQNYENYLKSKSTWPYFKKEEIFKLFFGDKLYNGKLMGLVYHVGQIDENKIGSEQCLNFVCKLISFEFNPDCENFILVLKKGRLEFLNSMNLVEHIKNKNGILNAYRILKIFYEDDEKKLFTMLDSNEALLSNFLKWIEEENNI